MNKIKCAYKKYPLLKVVTSYIAFILVMTLVLKLPILMNEGYSISLLDAFFTSNSAIATTGLTVFNYVETYNYLGWFVLVFLFNVGGMGIIVLNTLLLLLFKKKIDYNNFSAAKVDYNQASEYNVKNVVFGVFKFFLAFEIIGTILLFFRLTDEFPNILDRFMNALFLSSSAVSGSGFYNSLIISDDYIAMFVVMILMIFSFIGYPVLLELSSYIKAKTKKERFRFSNFTKIVVKVNLVTTIAFALFFFFVEYDNAMISMDLMEKINASMYISLSTKSVGLNLFYDINEWMPVTLFVQTLFMLIGGAPSSACGGIKVVAIYLAYKYIKNLIYGKEDVMVYNTVIKKSTITRAFSLILLFILLSVGSTIIISVINPGLPIFNIWYDVVSGFTTTGFSTGVLTFFDPISIFVISILMGIGRIGILNLMTMFTNSMSNNSLYKRVEKDISL